MKKPAAFKVPPVAKAEEVPPVAEPILETFEPALDTETEIQEVAPVKPRRALVYPPFGYPIHVHRQGVLVRPGSPVEVEIDGWVQTQLTAGTLKEV